MKNLLDKVNAKLNAQGGFLKAISVLVGGTVFAQGLAILALPILTRIYSPSDFSLFAVYTSLIMVLSVASCLRFEIAIPIPEEKSEAVNLVVLSFLSNLLISILLFIIIAFFHHQIIQLLGQSKFSELIWLVPVGVFFLGVYNTFQYWATRQKQFKTIAKTRITQSVFGVITQISLGTLGFFSFGLIAGQIVKVSAGIRRLVENFLYDSAEILKKISFFSLKKTFIKNEKFPKFSTLEALANTAGVQLPIIFIASKVGGGEAGHLMLAMQVMAIPIAFIGSAVAQVYLANAPEELKKGKLKDFTIRCLCSLLKIGVVPLILLSILSPYIFPIIFGPEWRRSGEMMVWMIPWFCFQVLVSPISMSLNILDQQKTALLLQIIGLIIRCFGLYTLFYLSITSKLFEYYAISGGVFYFIYLCVVIYVINVCDRNVD
ncbi:oligosaccharide flippase family protein [Acinetobacter schindleri]|uniref:lipopolysaccharide biosynthesis protein n=1 Tax=Acinetobacter schindleri TaxID=108981 RepID=UPI002360E76B|nr:oligosaccharide flippase family protein [Acinetobacter schindleri]WDE16076.1 oligosaccharide flippase family protein [Acinetobacter schindleri]